MAIKIRIEKGIPLTPLCGTMDYAIEAITQLLKMKVGDSLLDLDGMSFLKEGRHTYGTRKIFEVRFPPSTLGRTRRIWRTR